MPPRRSSATARATAAAARAAAATTAAATPMTTAAVEQLIESKRGVRVAREDDHGVTKGREDVREVFQRHGSGAKRKISRCGRNQMGNEPMLALPEGADDFVVYYDARSKDLEACLGKRRRNVEEPVEIMDREVKSLKRSKIALVKVRWNSKRGPEFTWEHEDYMKSKYPQFFVDRADSFAS
ncbi:hypothetical protein Tco_0143893 [Tanacetum coccineum]